MVDASVMQTLMGRNTQVPTVMIVEKAANLLRRTKITAPREYRTQAGSVRPSGVRGSGDGGCRGGRISGRNTAKIPRSGKNAQT